MSASSTPPLRDVTPEQRRATWRTFVWILAAFLAGIGIMVAGLSVSGRAVREYGKAVLGAVHSSPSVTVTRGGQDCRGALNRPLPGGALSCQVEWVGEDQHPEVVIQVEGGRQYRVKP